MESVDPESAVELYISDRKSELADSSIYAHRSHLGHLVEWCEQNEVSDLSTLTGLEIKEFAAWRRETGDVNTVTLNTQLSTLSVFIQWCESVDAVRDGLSDAVHVPTLSDGEDERDEMLDEQVAEKIIEYLDRYQYASVEHVTMLLMWRGLLRRGAIRAIDVDDTDLDGEKPRIELHHRPESGTPLKNEYDAERHLALQDETATVIQDHIDQHRVNVTDEDGRAPLLTSQRGRRHVSTIQSIAYGITRPCAVGAECPHDRDPDTCDAARRRQWASKCPSSKSPHAIRRGAITHWLRSDVPERVVSDRASTSPEVMSTHYDKRTEREKSEQRRQFLEDV
jgi:integrase